jgi:hypothetical protein
MYFYGGTTRVATLTGTGGLTVTGLTTGSLTASGNVNISGTLTVSGTTTTINSTTVDVKDRIIHVNHTTGTVAVPTLLTGLGVHRGNTGSADRDHASVVWDEAAQHWAFAFTTTNDSGYGTGGYLPLRAKQVLVDSDPTLSMQVATKNYVDSAVTTGGATSLLSTNNTWTNTNTWNGDSYFNGLVKITGNPAALQLNNSFIYADQSNPSVINIGGSTTGQPTVTINPVTNTVSFASNANVILPNNQNSNIFLGPLIPIASTSSNVYPLPYDRTNEFIYAGGIPQIRNEDYVISLDGLSFSFTPPLDSGIEVTGTAASNAATVTATGSSVSSHFVEVGPGNGVTTSFNLPGSQQEEIIILGRTYLCKRGTLAGGSASGDYYIDNGTTIEFFTPPAAGVSIMVSVGILLLAGTDAQTVQGLLPSPGADLNTLAVRDADGVLLATQSLSLGNPLAENAVIVADATGRIPVAALPSDLTSIQTINGVDIQDFVLSSPGSPAAPLATLAEDSDMLGGQLPSYYAPRLNVTVFATPGAYTLNAWNVAVTKLASLGTVNYTLPTSPAINTQVIIKDAGYTASNDYPINIYPGGSDTVEGTISLKIVGAGNSVTLIFDGVGGWWIV